MTRVIVVPAGSPPSPALLAPAAAAAAGGALVVFPTDTVYGVGTNGLLPAATARLYALKGRDPAKPLPILVHSTQDARRWAEFGPEAAALARAFWPGALTLVLQPTKAGRRLLSPGARTLAVRVPAHAVT
ncbi:MAG: Sua5/YciO/YrdC/YwlC family protein, partial [Elusimicrobia bacterium]|nr:Sua5/YciO/YrdC/YwlC family protein [Elusimicrobiota bacterium]